MRKLKNPIITSSHILSLYPMHEAVEVLGKLGYSGIEIWAEELELQILKKRTTLAKILAALKRWKMTGAVHAPLKDLTIEKPYKFNICSKDSGLRSISLEKNLDALDTAKKLGFKVVTVHPGHTDLEGEHADKLYWKLQIDAFRTLARRAERLGIDIGLEPMEHRKREFVMEPPQVHRIIKAVRSKRLGVTFDLIHAYSHGVDKPVEFLEGLHPHIVHVHMSGHSKEKNHVPFSMSIIHHFYLDRVLKDLVGRYKRLISIEGSLPDAFKVKKLMQKKVVKENLEYVHSELKSLHLE